MCTKKNTHERPSSQKGVQPVLDDQIKNMIMTYFEALDQKDFDTVMSLTHPSYALDVPSLLAYIRENSISFNIVSCSLFMDQDEFRKTIEHLYEEDVVQPVFERGLSYNVQLVFEKDQHSHRFLFYMDVAETEDGWKVLDPLALQAAIGIELKIKELKRS